MQEPENVLTEEQQKQILDVFLHYQQGGDSSGYNSENQENLQSDLKPTKIKSSQLNDALKQLDVQLMPEQLKEVIAQCETEEQEIEFPEFVAIMSRQVKDIFGPDELIESFKVFDPNNTGIIQKAEFRHIMINYGEKLSPEEAEEICKEADSDGNGLIDYKKFVAVITQTK